MAGDFFTFYFTMVLSEITSILQARFNMLFLYYLKKKKTFCIFIDPKT